MKLTYKLLYFIVNLVSEINFNAKVFEALAYNKLSDLLETLPHLSFEPATIKLLAEKLCLLGHEDALK